MSYNVTGTTITLTRGDTFEALVSATTKDGLQYTPEEGDTIRFALKEDYSDVRPLIVKDIPISTMTLVLLPEDTKDLNFGKYVYDIQLTRANGKVDTFITKAVLKLSIPLYANCEHEEYDGAYTITPGEEQQVLNTANKLLTQDIVIESSQSIPADSSMATDDDITDLIEEIFGNDSQTSDSDNTTYDEEDIATDEELDDVLTDVFG